MSRWSCTRSLCCRCGPLAWYEIYRLQSWGFEPRAWYEIDDCGAHWVCNIILHYAGLIILWELEKSYPGAKILSGLNIRLDSRKEPIASVAASLEIRRSNLTSYKCLILPMISWQKHTEVSYYKLGNVLLCCTFLSNEEEATKRYFYRIRSEWII